MCKIECKRIKERNEQQSALPISINIDINPPQIGSLSSSIRNDPKQNSFPSSRLQRLRIDERAFARARFGSPSTMFDSCRKE